MYICPTPLGNLEDITLRVLRILREADIIAAEDTRRTRKLLNHFQINTATVSYHQHSSSHQVDRLVENIKAGQNIALVSDAGTPGISDPGQHLIQCCINEGIEVDPLPGACAAITAISGSGYPLASFTYHGFLPRKGLDKAVAALRDAEHPVVLYESPQRIEKLLKSLERHMPQRELVVARELTKVHQQFLRGKPGEVLAKILSGNLARGEFTLVLGPWQHERTHFDPQQVWTLVQDYLGQGLSTRDAVTRVSADTKYSRRKVYNLVNKKKQDT